MGVKHSVPKSFYYAFSGIKTAYSKEPNLRIHTIVGITAMTMGALLGFSLLEWMFLLFTIFFVIILELLNTVLEAIVNLVQPEVHPYAKIAKDVSAACVLTAAFMSILIGIILFLPKILRLT